MINSSPTVLPDQLTQLESGQTSKVTTSNGSSTKSYTIPSTGTYAIIASKDVNIYGSGKIIVGTQEYNIPQAGTLLIKEFSSGTEIKFKASEGDISMDPNSYVLVKYTVYSVN